MDIITQLFANEIMQYLLRHWRLETMIAIIVFSITFYFMNKKLNRWKRLCFAYDFYISEFSQRLKITELNIKKIEKTLVKQVEQKKEQDLMEAIKQIVTEQTAHLQNNNQSNIIKYR